MSLIKTIQEIILREGLIKYGDSIIVAVSGGPDSVALLHALHTAAPALSLQLFAVHVNHHFRGDEAIQEAEGVRKLAAALSIPCDIVDVDVPQYMKESGLNAQEAARVKRYECLLRIAKERGVHRIALGHHADDQAETVLMRIIQGTGVEGLNGIPLRRTISGVELIRPLLRIHKAELLEYCHDQHLAYFTDSSNLQRKYFRNQVRLDVLPLLQQYNPQVVNALVRMADLAVEDNSYLEQETERIFTQTVDCRTGECRLSRNTWTALHLALQRRLIKLILSYLSPQGRFLDFGKIEAVRNAILQASPTTLSLDIGGGLCFYREYDRLRFTSQPLTNPISFAYTVTLAEGRLELPQCEAMMEWKILDRVDFAEQSLPQFQSANAREAWFDMEGLSIPLCIRNRNPGDRIQLEGLNGLKKVKNMFIDLKIPPYSRDRIPLLADADNRILWIPGIRRSALQQVKNSTDRILHMRYKPFIH